MAGNACYSCQTQFYAILITYLRTPCYLFLCFAVFPQSLVHITNISSGFWPLNGTGCGKVRNSDGQLKLKIVDWAKAVDTNSEHQFPVCGSIEPTNKEQWDTSPCYSHKRSKYPKSGFFPSHLFSFRINITKRYLSQSVGEIEWGVLIEKIKLHTLLLFEKNLPWQLIEIVRGSNMHIVCSNSLTGEEQVSHDEWSDIRAM